MMTYDLVEKFVFTHRIYVLCIALLGFAVQVQAQNGWTTPVRINPTTLAEQDFQRIAVGPQREIAIACREGNITGRMAVYRSTDNGTTFLRTQIATPPVPEFEMRRTEALEFDADGNLYLLWSWNETPGGIGLRQWLVISKSTDGGQSFFTFWSNAQRVFNLQQHKMIVTSDRTIHVIRDSLVPPPETGKEIYTRFINGNPANKVEVVLPQPGDTVYTREKVDMLIHAGKIHYAAVGRPNSTPFSKLYYSRSFDNGLTFSSMIAVDSCVPSFGVSHDGRVVLFGGGGDLVPFPHGLLGAKYVIDSTITFSSLFFFGDKWWAIDGTTRLQALPFRSSVAYGGVDTQSVTCYYEYSDLQSAPTDSAFFPLLKHPDFAVDSLGGKYIVAEHQHDFRVYFTKSDVVDAVQETSKLPEETALFQNFPNPFNPSTAISFALPKDSHVSLQLYDLLGREVQSLVDEWLTAGYHQVTLDGNSLATGVYVYRMIAGNFTASRKLLLVK